MIHVITWKDLKIDPTRSEVCGKIVLNFVFFSFWKIIFFYFKKTATFQLIMALSYSQQKTYIIFNYGYINWVSTNKNVFIGYSNGNTIRVTNQFSNNGDSNGNPALITRFNGNTGQKGLYVYDLSNLIPSSKCSLWYYNKILSPSYVPINPFGQNG